MYVVNWMLYTVQVVKEALQFLWCLVTDDEGTHVTKVAEVLMGCHLRILPVVVGSHLRQWWKYI
jgi:hypothetical protein